MGIIALISLFILVLFSVFGAFFFILIRNNKKLLRVSLPTFVIICFILIIPISIEMKDRQEEYITQIISEKGWEIVEIMEVDPDESPFQNDVRKKNNVFKIIYLDGTNEKIAWFRGIDVFIYNTEESDEFFREKWIFPSEN